MKTIKEDQLFYYDEEANSDKVYQVFLYEVELGYIVNFAYGRNGYELKQGTKTSDPVTLEEAESIYSKLIASKVKKGYQLE